MKKIPLTQGKFAIVDDEDFEYLKLYKWHACYDGTRWNVIRSLSRSIGGKRPGVCLSTFIMGISKGHIICHLNSNQFDFQRKNLRFVTREQNSYHRRKTNKPKTSKYKGVCLRKERNAWIANIQFKGKLIYLGYFKLEEDAARAYDKAAKEYFGEYGLLNFKE